MVFFTIQLGVIDQRLTIWATTKAAQRRRPGISAKHQPRERVTKMSAWLMMLTCRYSADIISSRLPCSGRTPNVFCRRKVYIVN